VWDTWYFFTFKAFSKKRVAPIVVGGHALGMISNAYNIVLRIKLMTSWSVAK
jgi:hypothetical protein